MTLVTKGGFRCDTWVVRIADCAEGTEINAQIDDAAQCYACLQSWGALFSKSSERAGLSKLSRP